MKVGIYKEVQIDASHRLLHYKGKCASLHGHRWKVEVWIEGEPDAKTNILIDYNLIKLAVAKYDHQIILNEDDPMVAAIRAVPARDYNSRGSNKRTARARNPE